MTGWKNEWDALADVSHSPETIDHQLDRLFNAWPAEPEEIYCTATKQMTFSFILQVASFGNRPPGLVDHLISKTVVELVLTCCFATEHRCTKPIAKVGLQRHELEAWTKSVEIKFTIARRNLDAKIRK
jgi:hypothetical protein